MNKGKTMVVKEKLKKLINYTVTIDGKEERPIVIMAPDGSDENSLRIYAFDGNIGRIPLTEEGKYQLADKGYSKYITYPKYPIINKNTSHIYEFPNWLGQFKQEDKCKEELEEYLRKEKGELREYFDVDSLYLPLILAASRNRFTCKNKDNYGTKMERWKQQEIAKYFMEHSSEKGSIITDLEFDIPISDERKKVKAVRADTEDMQKMKGASKPDFVIFDGQRFGIVEFKYLGQSMKTHSSNSLDWHLLDFYDAFENDAHDRIELYNKCLDRLKCLLDYGVIFPDDSDKRKEFETKMNSCRRAANSGKEKELKDLFWFGFLFVGGKKSTIKNNIRNQLIEPVLPKKCEGEKSQVEKNAAKTVKDLIENEGIELYGRYCDDSDNISDFSIDLKEKTIKELYKELYKELESKILEEKKKH